MKKIVMGEKWTLLAKPGFGRQQSVNKIIEENKPNFDAVMEMDLNFTAPLGVFLHLCNRMLSGIGDENMNGAMSRPNTNYMMILYPLFSSLRSKKILFIFYHPEQVYSGNQWLDKNWGQFFIQFLPSDFTACVFVSSNASIQLSPDHLVFKPDVSENPVAAVAYICKQLNVKFLPENMRDDVSYNRFLEQIFQTYWKSLDEFTRSKLAFYSGALHVISKRFIDREDEKIKLVLTELTAPKIDGFVLDDWIGKLIYGNLTSTERKFIHAEWAKKLALTPRNPHHPETWALHHHLFFSQQFLDSIDLLNEIVDDQLNMDIDGYLPRILHEYDEAKLSEDLEREIDDIRDLL